VNTGVSVDESYNTRLVLCALYTENDKFSRHNDKDISQLSGISLLLIQICILVNLRLKDKRKHQGLVCATYEIWRSLPYIEKQVR
jgi:hypothetical protein